MTKTTGDNKQIQSPRFNMASVLATSIYAATVVMIFAYLYQSLSTFFWGQ
jgi:hypothetical protein